MLEDLKRFARWIFGWLVVLYFAVALVGIGPIGRDDTDPAQWGHRSGIKPRTDHLTGCQYLETLGGGITPRLDRNGRHIGCSEGGAAPAGEDAR